MGVLTGRLPLLLLSAGSTGALRHSNPPVTSEDREDGGSGGWGGGSSGLTGSFPPGIKVRKSRKNL